MPLVPCPSCGTHALSGSRCPHCGAPPAARSLSAAAAVLGLVLVGCVGASKDTTSTTEDTDYTTFEPPYGIGTLDYSESDTDTDADSDTDTDTDTADDTGAGSDSGSDTAAR